MIIENLVAIGCDGTSVNTGFNGGVIRLIEEKLNKPLHWFIFQLHANELPLRHVVQKLDGKTEKRIFRFHREAIGCVRETHSCGIRVNTLRITRCGQKLTEF